jgi:hypothetical protein
MNGLTGRRRSIVFGKLQKQIETGEAELFSDEEKPKKPAVKRKRRKRVKNGNISGASERGQ